MNPETRDNKAENRFAVQVGDSYKQADCILRILGVQDKFALMEQWSIGGKLIQYIVTHSLCLENDELHWRGSGAYFPCVYPPPTCDAPFTALTKALAYMVSRTQPEEPHSAFGLQVVYYEQDSRTNDTVRFDIPAEISEEEFVAAVKKIAKEFSDSNYLDADHLEVTDEMLSAIAKAVGGTWDYVELVGVVSVQDGNRVFLTL